MNAPSDTQRWAKQQLNNQMRGRSSMLGKDVENCSATAIRAYRPAVGHRVYTTPARA